MQVMAKKADSQIKDDVLAELNYEPRVKATDIGVLVKEGVVTLTGFVRSYGEKCDALSAAQRVFGVRAVAQDLEVKFSDEMSVTDGGIAAAAAAILDSYLTIPKGSVQVTVSKQWVTLKGEVEWWYQKTTPENALRHLKGMKGLINQMTIRQVVAKPKDIEAAIESAFERSAIVDAKKVNVSCSGSKVTLTGQVPHFLEREEAERAAWGAIGILHVDNQIEVA